MIASKWFEAWRDEYGVGPARIIAQVRLPLRRGDPLQPPTFRSARAEIADAGSRR